MVSMLNIIAKRALSFWESVQMALKLKFRIYPKYLKTMKITSHNLV
jgi:hypothetical protein